METKIKTPWFHIARKTDVSLKEVLIVKFGAVIGAFLLFGIITTIISPGSFGSFYLSFIKANFNFVSGKPDILYKTTMSTLYQFALLFFAAICLLPSFKMRFWNLGVAGQVSVGCIGAFAIMNFLSPYLPNPVLLILMLVAAVICAVVWSIIPAIFKAFFNTNETLFTLMMNYIAVAILNFFVKKWANNVSGGISPINGQGTTYEYQGWFTPDNYVNYIIVAAVVLVLTILVVLYLKKTKHGYEISVVGGSVNTAKYVGINVKKVIIRTLAFTGILAGILAFLVVAVNHTLSSSFSDSGYSFSGVLTLWAGGANPIITAVYSLVYIIARQGVANAAGDLHVDSALKDVYTAILFLIIIGTEFFLNYKILFFKKNKIKKEDLKKPQDLKEIGGNK